MHIPAPRIPDETIEALAQQLCGRRFMVVAGAGCSTESGIPDYRGPLTRNKPRNPIQYRPFVRDAAVRQRYWARSYIGWPKMRSARPNDGHAALARMEEAGAITGLVTQNVDRLHQAAGSQALVELHGALAEVECLHCGRIERRDTVQRRMAETNPEWARLDAVAAPDGDAELRDGIEEHFIAPWCVACGGPIKPHVVFFGENVPKWRVERAFDWLNDADGLLVVGSSLKVFSGYRFVLAAEKAGKPVIILNLGETRGDKHATLKVEARLGDVLPRIGERLCRPQSEP